MYQKKRERLYISQLLENPSVTYPSYYSLSPKMIKNEMLHTALIILHSLDFDYYQHPNSYEDIFTMFSSGTYPIYKEMYVVGYFGGKMMYLDTSGWRGMPCNKDVFKMDNWLIC